jgi:hypothetical protein
MHVGTRKISEQKHTISFVNKLSSQWCYHQLTDYIGCSRNIFLDMIKWVSLAMSADGNSMNYQPFWSPCMHKCTPLLVLQIYILNLRNLREYTNIQRTISLVKQVQSRWQTRLFTTKNIFVGIMEGGCPAMSAGDNPTIFWPIKSACVHNCIILLVLRFLWLEHKKTWLGHARTRGATRHVGSM